MLKSQHVICELITLYYSVVWLWALDGLVLKYNALIESDLFACRCLNFWILIMKMLCASLLCLIIGSAHKAS